MENNNSGFQVVFRIRSKKRVIPSKSISDTIGILSGYQVIEEPQYTEDGVGIEVFEIYKEYTGKSDMSFSDFKRLDLKQAYFWNQHKEFKVEISEQDARDSGLFKYRSSFICWGKH